jgi:tetratricopeptide (TPR) repeat protein
MIDREKLKYIIKELRAGMLYPEARKILDMFFKQAKTIEDYDAIGECSVIAQYHELRLKCAEFVLSSVTTFEQLFDARENLIHCYNALNYPEKALFYIDINLQAKPNDTDTLLHKAANLALLNKKQQASDIINNIAETTTDEKLLESIQNNKAMDLLRQGQTSKGIIAFMDAGKKKNPLFENELKLKFWNGGIQPGKTIVVNAEGGIGDEFINIRFLHNLKALGMNPILFSSWSMYRPDTVNLFKRHGFEVVTNHYGFKPDYLWTHMMSLPGYLGLSESQLWERPYLQPMRKEKNKLNDNNFKIGIKCNGNPYFEQDIYRSIPIEEMLEVLPENASVYYFDLDKEHPRTKSLKGKIKTWDDTLDFIDQMDIIVSSCTSLVHAAGAMGKSTAVLVPIAKYYTWESTRKDNSTPWYGDNFKVFHQQKPRSWKEPLLELKDYLNK